MRAPKISASFGIMVVAMITMAVLTIAESHFGNEGLWYATFPGLLCGLLITGGHGGTHMQEVIAQVVAVAVNELVALPFLIALYWISRGFHKRSAAK